MARQNTHDDAVGAGHGGAAAGGARADAHDADGAAVEAKPDVDVLQDDAEQTEEGGARSRVSLRAQVQHQCQR